MSEKGERTGRYKVIGIRHDENVMEKELKDGG